MRHVTDGELHAFLDGGLDLLPDARGEEIRSHIADCPVCRERLQDEEAIRSQAEGILGAPDLGEVTLPTFEELRELSEAPLPEPMRDEEKVRYRGPLKGLPLAWAATIVLALGVGWMGGQVFRSLPEDARLGRPADFLESLPPAEADQGQPVADSLSPSGPPLQEAVFDLDAPVRRTPAGGQEEEVAEEMQRLPAATSAVTEPGRTGEVRAQVEPGVQPKPSEPETARAATPEVMLREVVVLPDSPTADLVLTAARRNPSETVAPATTELDRPRPAADLLAFELVSGADSLEEALGVPGLAVPGFEVVSIDWEERVAGERALLIRQSLSPGDTLELHYLGLFLGTPPEPRPEAEIMPLEEISRLRVYANVLEASLPQGWSQVVMERKRGLLVARAPTDEEHLKALLKTLR